MSDHDVISVVGGGWSVKNIDLAAIPGFIIGVNDSAINLPRCDMAVTMDRLWTEYRFEKLHEMHMQTWLRRVCLKNISTWHWPWLHVFECDYETTAEFSEDHGWLNGTNSGMCAFNKAYQMRPKTIYLFGFDMRRGPKGQIYWFKPYPWRPQGGTSDGKYNQWAKEFSMAARKCKAAGIEVINASIHSAIKDFPKTREFEKKVLA